MTIKDSLSFSSTNLELEAAHLNKVVIIKYKFCKVSSSILKLLAIVNPLQISEGFLFKSRNLSSAIRSISITIIKTLCALGELKEMFHDNECPELHF